MNKKAKSAVAAAVLLATFTTNALSVENQPINVAEQIEKSFVPIKQVQMDSTFAKSATVDAIVNVKREVSRVKNRVYYPNNTPKNDKPLSGKPKNHSKREDSADAKMDRLTKDGIIKKSNFPKTGKNAEQKLTVAQVINILYPKKTSKQLSSLQRKEVLNAYNWLLKQKETLAWLIALTKVEGAPKPNTVVGYLKTGGYKNKTTDCQNKISKLTLKAHAKDQGLPQRCFVTTGAGPSSAFGFFQFVNRTWQPIKKRLNFKNFSRNTQAKAALELARQSSKEGFTGLIKGDLVAARKATSPWAGSDASNLPGSKSNFVKAAKNEMKKLKDKAYYQKWLNEFFDDRTS